MSNNFEEAVSIAKDQIENGAQIIGGCCGLGVEEIKAISVLKESNNDKYL